jgi:adenylosuccinate lyase
VGKRATLWLQELLLDLEALDFQLASLKFFGCKGTTGTGASFLALFDGDADKVKELELRIAAKMGFESVVPVAGQTYSRKIDYNILSVLCGIAQSATKFATDVRLLAHCRRRRSPLGISRWLVRYGLQAKPHALGADLFPGPPDHDAVALPAVTAASQWMERTLDDSANRRIVLPEAFFGRGCDPVAVPQRDRRTHRVSPRDRNAPREDCPSSPPKTS